MSFQLKYGPWAIVTGASAGLGEHYARQLAERGLNLIIIARRGDLLEELAAELIAIHKVDIECLALDLTADDAVDKVIAACSDKDVGLLVNNAGFGLKNEFIQNPPQRLRDMVRLNCEVPVLLSHALIQKMANRDSSGIINLASVAGFQPTPFM
ncbi:MAG: SDR family NAD(P)-dependent oxidoreductase, partial [Planctomycetota bacterium]|nr:SDR family NAD(P)-dependent oxidoreductase [Planctomycetota bacterium]